MENSNKWNLPNKKIETPELENLSFSNLSVFQSQEECSKTYELQYFGEKLKLKAAHSPSMPDFISECHSIDVFKGDAKVFHMHFLFYDKSERANVISSVEKHFENKDVFKGVGVLLFKKMLDYLQDMADQRSKTFVHSVFRDPNFCETKDEKIVEMDCDEMNMKWDKIFLEILRERKYEMINPNQWAKEYFPEINN